MSVQSNDEALRIFDEWSRLFAPPNLILNEKNGLLLADYVLKTYGIFSISYLTEAANALASQLDLVPEPPKKTQEQLAAEFQAREYARIQREAAENAKPFDHGKKVQESLDAKEAAKLQATAQSQIDHLIHNYSVNASTPGRIDHGKSDSNRAILRNIKIQRGGKYDAVLTLRVLQQAHMFDTPKEIVRAAEKAKMGIVAAVNAKPDKGPIR